MKMEKTLLKITKVDGLAAAECMCDTHQEAAICYQAIIKMKEELRDKLISSCRPEFRNELLDTFSSMEIDIAKEKLGSEYAEVLDKLKSMNKHEISGFLRDIEGLVKGR
jgi:hypothetical protein